MDFASIYLQHLNIKETIIGLKYQFNYIKIKEINASSYVK